MKRESVRSATRCVGSVLLVLMIVGAAPAQKFISIKAGVIQFAEGDVLLDGKPLQVAVDSYVQMENGQRLITKRGRIEMSLAPNIFLRLCANSALYMTKNSFNDTQLSLEKGTAWIQVMQQIEGGTVLEMLKGNRLRVGVSDSSLEFKKSGLYRLDADSSELRVYAGAAVASIGDRKATIEKGRMVHLEGNLAPAKFEANSSDALHEWMDGVIQFTVGEVFLDGRPIEIAIGSYEQMANGQILSTKDGSVELLVAPGIFVRLGFNGSLRMEKNQRFNRDLALERGSALIEVVRMQKENRIKVRASNGILSISKPGLYRLDADSSELRIYGGAAAISVENRRATIKNNQMVHLNAGLVPAKFDAKEADPFHQWAARRSFDVFIASPASWLFDRHWRHQGEGWLANSNFRMRFHSDRYDDTWTSLRRVHLERFPTAFESPGVIDSQSMRDGTLPDNPTPIPADTTIIIPPTDAPATPAK